MQFLAGEILILKIHRVAKLQELYEYPCECT